MTESTKKRVEDTEPIKLDEILKKARELARVSSDDPIKRELADTLIRVTTAYQSFHRKVQEEGGYQRPSFSGPDVMVQVRIPESVVQVLASLAQTGMYGRDPGEVIERFALERLREEMGDLLRRPIQAETGEKGEG